MKILTQKLCDAVSKDLLENIAPFWLKYTIDQENGGFYGRVSNSLIPDTKADKGLILTTRILWTFSALYRMKPCHEFYNMAQRAYQYLLDKFLDKEFGGVYWMLSYEGQPTITQKKIYGQAFTIYALAEYYKATQEAESLNHAQSIYYLIEKHNYDESNTGYFESSERDWSVAKDMRLSDKDMDEKKSMNTHLHLLEAYTNLLEVWPDKRLRLSLKRLLQNFLEHILDTDSLHFRLFFDESWNSKSQTISYGHDIEGSWLLCEAADILREENTIKTIRNLAVKMTDTAIKEGFDENWAIYSERSSDGHHAEVTHWWQQAESLVGTINAFQITSQEKYLSWAMNIWKYIEDHFIDHQNGDWFYEISMQSHQPSWDIPKVSEWKCPYHNGRACIEILKRL